jgi:hypothetical protein
MHAQSILFEIEKSPPQKKLTTIFSVLVIPVGIINISPTGNTWVVMGGWTLGLPCD